MLARFATVTASTLNVRSGPGTEFPVVRQLRRDDRVEVSAVEGNWVALRLNGESAFAHKNFLFLPETDPPAGFLRERPELRTAPLAPTAPKQPSPGAGATPEAKLAARTWNAYGGLLGALSALIGVEPGASVAVLAVESSGSGFADGRMKIRFENHILWLRWARNNPEREQTFRQHFRFDPGKKWLGHEFRAKTGAAWTSVHTNQASEWRVLDFARQLDDTAALSSISMGSAQIMGFNHASAGYQTVQEMFTAFSDAQEGERNQILGLFDFLKGPGNASPMVSALQHNDFVAFAARYNGQGKAVEYGMKIEKYWKAFQSLAGA